VSGGNRYRHLGGGTIGGLLRARAMAVPEHPLVIASGRTHSYADVAQSAERIARSFIACGCQKGDRIAVLSGNTVEYVRAWLGLELAGLLHVPINTAYKRDFLAYIIEHSGARALVLEPSLLNTLLTARGALGGVEAVILTSDRMPKGVQELGVAKVFGWSEFLSLGQSSIALPDVEPSDIAGIMYTSGTTGRSKGALMPHLAKVVMADETGAALGITASDTMYTCLPLFHGNARLCTVLCAINAGASVGLGRRFSASRFWAEVRDCAATEFNALGSLLYMLMAQPETPGDRTHGVRIAFAAPAPADILYRFERRFGVTLIEGYGQTETKNVSFNPREARRPGSIGKPTPTSIVAIVDPDGHQVSPGEVGEIVYRPTQPDIMNRGYYRDPEATLAAMKDLWWHTGDLGFQDLDGYLYFVDRSKDALRRRGENISSQEVESVLLAHPDVLEAAAVSVASDVGEDEVMAVLCAVKGSTLDWPEFFRFCDDRLPYFMVPRYYRIADALPHTANGKIRKNDLRAIGVTGDTWDSVAHGLTPTKSHLLGDPTKEQAVDATPGESGAR
jgi:crotonobetaine/carnitine-CoA ligase